MGTGRTDGQMERGEHVSAPIQVYFTIYRPLYRPAARWRSCTVNNAAGAVHDRPIAAKTVA